MGGQASMGAQGSDGGGSPPISANPSLLAKYHSYENIGELHKIWQKIRKIFSQQFL